MGPMSPPIGSCSRLEEFERKALSSITLPPTMESLRWLMEGSRAEKRDELIVGPTKLGLPHLRIWCSFSPAAYEISWLGRETFCRFAFWNSWLTSICSIDSC